MAAYSRKPMPRVHRAALRLPINPIGTRLRPSPLSPFGNRRQRGGLIGTLQCTAYSLPYSISLLRPYHVSRPSLLHRAITPTRGRAVYQSVSCTHTLASLPCALYLRWINFSADCTALPAYSAKIKRKSAPRSVGSAGVVYRRKKGNFSPFNPFNCLKIVYLHF